MNTLLLKKESAFPIEAKLMRQDAVELQQGDCNVNEKLYKAGQMNLVPQISGVTLNTSKTLTKPL